MEKVKKSFIILVGLTLPLTFFHCTKYKESAPFFEGMFLEYDYGGGLKLIYNVRVLDNSKFEIIEKDTFFKSSRGKKEMYVDEHGRVYKSSFEDYEGGFSPIWIPVHELKVGDSFDGEYTVIRKDKWKKWEVLVVKDSIVGAEQYFDINTGYSVGLFGKGLRGAVTIVLVNTNADIPTVEE